jgi:hypothetical protein
MKNFKVKVQVYDADKDTYTTNKVYIIQRVVRSELDTLVELQKELLLKFIEVDTNIGELIRNNETWELMKTLAKNLNVLGQKNKGFDLEEISDDLEQICQMFFTQSMTSNGEYEYEDGWKPSLIAELHQLDFPFYLRESVKKHQENKENQVKEIEKS